MALAGCNITWTPSADPNADEQDVYIGTNNPPTTAVATSEPLSTSAASRAAFAEPGDSVFARIVTRNTTGGVTSELTEKIDMGGVAANLADPTLQSTVTDGFVLGPVLTWTTGGGTVSIASVQSLVVSVEPNAHTGAASDNKGFTEVGLYLDVDTAGDGSFDSYAVVETIGTTFKCDDTTTPEVRTDWTVPDVPTTSVYRLRAVARGALGENLWRTLAVTPVDITA